MNGEQDHYLEIPTGWQKLVKDTHDKILLIDPHYEVIEIKEKHAALRYYIKMSYMDTMNRSKIAAIIYNAENESRKICQNCSEPGVPRQVNGWYATLCADCWNKKERGYDA